MRTAGDDRVFDAGAILDKPALLTRLSEQDTLSKNLRTVVQDMMRTNAKLDSNTAVLDRAFNRLEDDGYIKVEDREAIRELSARKEPLPLFTYCPDLFARKKGCIQLKVLQFFYPMTKINSCKKLGQ